MPLIPKLANLLYKRQQLLEMLAIFLVLSTVAFRFNNKQVKLFWSDYPFIALSIVLVLILIALVWVQIQKQKLNSLMNELKDNTGGQNLKVNDKVNQLSNRQKEVLELIVQGKSNKDIMTLLNIELSTLKTHINQIYKVLEIKTRKEARSVGNQVRKDT